MTWQLGICLQIPLAVFLFPSLDNWMSVHSDLLVWKNHLKSRKSSKSQGQGQWNWKNCFTFPTVHQLMAALPSTLRGRLPPFVLEKVTEPWTMSALWLCFLWRSEEAHQHCGRDSHSENTCLMPPGSQEKVPSHPGGLNTYQIGKRWFSAKLIACHYLHTLISCIGCISEWGFPISVTLYLM